MRVRKSLESVRSGSCCVCEREREREGEIAAGTFLLEKMAMLTEVAVAAATAATAAKAICTCASFFLIDLKCHWEIIRMQQKR